MDRKSKSLDKRKIVLDKKEKIVITKLTRLNQAIEKNKQILKEIREAILNKIIEAYTKMSPAKAAAILASMESGESASILFLLKPKVMSNILAKMDAIKASNVTLLIKKGPPFKKDERTFAIKKPAGIEKAIEQDFAK